MDLRELKSLQGQFVDPEKAAYYAALVAIAERIERLAIAVEQQVRPEMPMIENLLGEKD